MVLGILVRNSNTTIGCIDESDGSVLFSETISSDSRKTAAEYSVTVKIMLDLHGIDTALLTGCIISSSAPQVTPKLRRAAELLTKGSCRILEVGPGIKTGVDIKIEDPGQLGSDLLTGAVAGLEIYGAPLVLIDFGTSITFSVINEKRKFIGGMIMPGIRVALDGLIAAAAHLPQIEIKRPERLVNGTTVEAMQSGIVYGFAASVDGMLERLEAEFEITPAVVASGEFATAIIPECRHNIIIDEQLNMKGLGLIYRKNTRRR